MKFALYLSLMLVSTVALGKKPAPPAEMYLMDSSVLPKMTDLERSDYLEALRDFMSKNNERIPNVSQMMMDELLGAQAAIADTSAIPSVCLNGNVISNRWVNGINCYGKFRDAAKTGRLGACDETGTETEGNENYAVIRCGGQTYRYSLGSSAMTARGQADDMKKGWVPASQTAVQNRQQEENPTAAAPGRAGSPAASNDRPTPASGPSAAPTAQENWIQHREKGKSARCFFAGFSIARADKNSRCSPLTDLCGENLRLSGMQSGDLKKVMNCPADAAKAKCGSAAGAPPSAGTVRSTIRQNQNSSSQIPCNPVLYGLKDKAVICVSKKSNASEECARLADNDGLKEILKKEEGRTAFNKMLESIKNECRSYWRIDGDAIVARGGTGESRDGDRNADDFKKTCKTLVERVIAIGGSIDSVKANTDFTKMVEAFKNTANNPDFVGPAAPSSGRR